MGIHDSRGSTFVSKSIESNIKVPGPVHHTKEDITSISCAFTFTIFNQSSFARDGDAHEVSIIQRFRTQPNCVYICHIMLIVSGILALQTGKVKPFSPNIHIEILLTGLHTLP